VESAAFGAGRGFPALAFLPSSSGAGFAFCFFTSNHMSLMSFSISALTGCPLLIQSRHALAITPMVSL
jgi:hypothetical protein